MTIVRVEKERQQVLNCVENNEKIIPVIWVKSLELIPLSQLTKKVIIVFVLQYATACNGNNKPLSYTRP